MLTKASEKELLTKNRINVVGLKVTVCNYESATSQILQMVGQNKGGYVCISTVHMAMEAYDDSDYAKMVNDADLVTPDGMPMRWMQRLQGAKTGSRVRGMDLMTKLFAQAEKDNITVGFYGSSQEVLDKISKHLQSDFPNLKTSYIYSPPFRPLSEEEDKEITENISKSGTDILFVGLGCPKQERWMATHSENIDSVMIGVGAAFDFYAGKSKEAPEWMGRIGLEWLFRLTQEPRRLWKRYIILNPRFICLAILQLSGLKKFNE